MKALVVYNKYSGNSKMLRRLDYIITMLKTKYAEVDCFKSTHPKSITEHIIGCNIDYDLILTIGGDGSVHEVINGALRLERKPTLAFIPAGTCNDAASTFGIRKNLKKTMEMVLNNKPAKIDAFKINNDYFTYGLAAGCLTEISYDAPSKEKKKMGKIAYYFQGLKAYKDTKTINISLQAGDRKIEGNFSLFLALSTRYLAGFKIHRDKRIYLDDGKLRITLIKKTSKTMNIIDFGMFLLFGEGYKHNIIHLDASDFKITSLAPTAYNTDGERYGKYNEINVSVIPQAIDVILSSKVYKKHILHKNKE